MRTLYLDCSMGISGDMTVAALVDLGVDPNELRAAVASLDLPEVAIDFREVDKEGFRALSFQVDHPPQHAHRRLPDIQEILQAADALSRPQRERALDIFSRIAGAEATVHGKSIDEVHFHEVGAVDSIVDIVCAAVGFDSLEADEVIASPIPTGRGQIEIAHGICPLPAPGTAELLKGIPLASVPVEAELTTPTGAAILASVVDRFGDLPEGTIERVGYGAGSRDIAGRANLLRIFLGESRPSPELDTVALLETNLDDVPGEVIGFAQQSLFEAGALDVFSVPIQMKKGRPGVLLSVLARPADVQRMEEILFRETGTFGIRRQTRERSKLIRQEETVETVYGPIRGKLGWCEGQVAVFSPEFEDCARLARSAGVPLRDIYRAAESAYRKV